MRTGSSKRGLQEGLSTVGLRTNCRVSSSPWIGWPLGGKAKYACGIRPFIRGNVLAERRWETLREAKVMVSASGVA